MKCISWNVNGIRACVQKGFVDFFKEADAYIFCLQETKMQEGQLVLDLPGYHQYWNSAVKKGYSGTAVFTKEEPLSVTYGLGIEEHDQEGPSIKDQTCINRQCQNQDYSAGIKTTETSTDDLACNKLPQRCR